MAGASSVGAEAFARRDWGEACRLLASAPPDKLEPADLERLAVCAYLVGRDAAATAAWESAYKRHLAAGSRADAAQCAFWVAFCWMMQGQMAHAGGWLSRTEGAIGDDFDCPAAGYLLIPALLGALESGGAARARDVAVQAGEIASRFDDRDLAAFSTLGHGQALLALGEEAAGLARLDEVMLSVSSGEVGPITTGIVYCAVILECLQLFDLARAAEWTAALDDWSATQPDLVPYRGQCLVHQSQLQQAAGDWSKAVATVGWACDRLTDPPHPALGLACYQEAELHRLRGNSTLRPTPTGGPAGAASRRCRGWRCSTWSAGRWRPRRRPSAERSARPASRSSGRRCWPPQWRSSWPPGTSRPPTRRRASWHPSPPTRARRRSARWPSRRKDRCCWRRARRRPRSVPLRAASGVWQQLRMPYETAKGAVLLGRGCLALGDRTSAELEFHNARETFCALGAEPDLVALRSLTGDAPAASGGLSARELQVLAHVAGGKTNREIADVLTISQHTVGRHLENIFAKLGVSGRAAATAYAYEHHLL